MRIFNRPRNIIIILALTIVLVVATMAYAQSPFRAAIRAPENVSGLNARVAALEARNAVLAAALLDLYYAKQFTLLTDRKWAANQGAGWGPFIRDLTEDSGHKWILGTEYINNLDVIAIPGVEGHIANLQP